MQTKATTQYEEKLAGFEVQKRDDIATLDKQYKENLEKSREEMQTKLDAAREEVEQAKNKHNNWTKSGRDCNKSSARPNRPLVTVLMHTRLSKE